MKNIFWMTLTFLMITIQSIQVEARLKQHSKDKLLILQKWKFIRFLQLFPIQSIVPLEQWTSRDSFLERNADGNLNKIFQVRRFNIGAKMARLNGDIPPLSSYYINFDQGSGSIQKTTNLLG